MGRIAQLPPPSTPLPRAKPLPKPREPTKWEAFAQRKGIVKRKRGKEVTAFVHDCNGLTGLVSGLWGGIISD